MIKLIRLIAIGNVQQVGYRAFTQRKAIEKGLRGQVKNLADGTVEVLVVDDKDLKDFIEDLKFYPDHNTPTQIQKTGVIEVGQMPEGFSIDYS